MPLGGLCRGVIGEYCRDDRGVWGEREGLILKPLVEYVLGEVEERSRFEG